MGWKKIEFSKKWKKLCLFFIIITNFVFSGYYCIKYLKEEMLLKGIIEAVAYDRQTDRQKIKAMVDWIYKHNKKISEKNNCPAYNLKCWPHFHPFWNVLKAPSDVILKIGGHCGNISRLSINIFHFMGYKAVRWHLWNTYKEIERWLKTGGKGDDPYSHAVVEVYLPSGNSIVIDPTFDIVYPYSMKFLKNHPDIIWKFVPKDYPWLYNYENPRGIRWHILGGKKVGDKIYEIFCKLLGKDAVDNLHYPFIFENPYLFLSIFHFVIEAFLLIWLLAFKFSKTKQGD